MPRKIDPACGSEKAEKHALQNHFFIISDSAIERGESRQSIGAEELEDEFATLVE